MKSMFTPKSPPPEESGPNGGISSFIADAYEIPSIWFTRLSDSSTKRTSSARKRMSMSAMAPWRT